MQKNIHFISYGNEKYEGAKQRIKNEAIAFGIFNSINVYSPSDINDNFRTKYFDVLCQSRGGGYWIWKEYFILKRLIEIEVGDYLIYCDAGCTINLKGIDRFEEYINMLDNDKMNYGIISFQLDCIEEQYTTSQIFSSLNIDDEYIKKSGQYIGGVLIMKKCDNVMGIFKDFFKTLGNDHMLITDYYNKTNQSKFFIDNRHDQSILSVVRKIRGSLVIPDETYYVNFNCEVAQKIPFLATRRR